MPRPLFWSYFLPEPQVLSGTAAAVGLDLLVAVAPGGGAVGGEKLAHGELDLPEQLAGVLLLAVTAAVAVLLRHTVVVGGDQDLGVPLQADDGELPQGNVQAVHIAAGDQLLREAGAHGRRNLAAAVVVAALAFVTGSNWGIPAITVPILIPLAAATGANELLVLGAIISGGTFGSHACFYSDCTALTSQACKMENLDHALSQLPYAVISAVVAIILFVIFGYVL